MAACRGLSDSGHNGVGTAKQRKRAKDTLTAVELERGETLEFTLRFGRVVTFEPAALWAEVARATIRSRGLPSR